MDVGHAQDEDIKKVQDSFEQKEKWLNETTAKLNAQPKFEDPCVTANQITQVWAWGMSLVYHGLDFAICSLRLEAS